MNSEQPEPCKHCHQRIARPHAAPNYVHVEGDHTGKHTCALEPYGYHAEPIGTPCSQHRANPCRGAKRRHPLATLAGRA